MNSGTLQNGSLCSFNLVIQMGSMHQQNDIDFSFSDHHNSALEREKPIVIALVHNISGILWLAALHT